MKKTLIVVYLFLGIKSFSFYKIKTKAFVDFSKSQKFIAFEYNYEGEGYIVNFLKNEKGKILYCTATRAKKCFIVGEPYKLVDCDFNYDSSFFDAEYIKQTKGFNYVNNKDFEIKKFLFSGSNIKITNDIEGVILNQKVNMTQALKAYFVRHPDEINGQELANYKPLKQKNYDLLQYSTILAIWTLIPKTINDKIIESEMIGLARDNRTHKLYHWYTDLSQDISILINFDPSNQIQTKIKRDHLLKRIFKLK